MAKAEIQVHPIPAEYLKISARWRPRPGPLFPGFEPTPADIELARDLFKALDDESQRWYRGFRVFADLMPKS